MYFTCVWLGGWRLLQPSKPKYGNYRLRGRNKRFRKTLNKNNNDNI